jgi:hypothetical protein
VALEQLLESRLVTGPGRSDQRVICRFFDWLHKCLECDRRRKSTAAIRPSRPLTFSS